MILTVPQIEAAGGYSIIYADPPWSYSDPKCSGGVAFEYPTMPLADICALPVAQLAARDAVLFLWATYPKVQEALSVITAWGFQYKSIAFQWVKVYANGKPTLGLGRWTRGNTEPCLLATRGKPKRVDAGVSQLVGDDTLFALNEGHSKKPAEVRARIKALMGDLPSLELFAREHSPGWDVWGNEIQSDITMERA